MEAHVKLQQRHEQEYYGQGLALQFYCLSSPSEADRYTAPPLASALLRAPRAHFLSAKLQLLRHPRPSS